MPALPCPQATSALDIFSTHLRPLAGVLAALCLAVASPVQAQLQETTNRIGIIMVRIPAGSFVMGACPKDQWSAFLGESSCTNSDPESSREEAPQHTVRVPAFQLGKTEVTLGQFKQFIAAADRTDLVNDDFMKYNRYGDNAPVAMVSWNDAQDFIAWLNQAEGKGWRLPSEAEWEYACRAGGNHTYCGSNDVSSVAWYDNNNGDSPRAVATKQPNAWGLHDMSGNQWEWVQDVYHFGYAGAPTDGSAWISGDQKRRMLRGGSWYQNASYSRATHRSNGIPDTRHYGFRVARNAL